MLVQDQKSNHQQFLDRYLTGQYALQNPDLDGRRHRRSIRNDGWVHLRVFRCSETSLGGFEVNLLIGFSEIYILVRDILKENYETLVWNASRSRGKGGRLRRLQAVHGWI